MDISGITPSYIPDSNAYITEAASSYAADMKKTEDYLDALRRAQEGNDQELMHACVEFESYFLQMMFKAMRKTVVEDDGAIFKKSNADLIFRDMLDEQVSISAANNGGIGLAAFMYKQMKREGITI